MTELGSRYEDGDYLDSNPGWHEERAEWKAEKVAGILCDTGVPRASICDAGCGTAGVLRALVPMLPGSRLVGYEPSPDGYELAQSLSSGSGVELVLGGIEAIAEPFDVALCLDVFEHVDDYLGFLRSLSDKATHFIFHIPLDLSAQAMVRSSLPVARAKLGHLHYFTSTTAVATLEDAGYSIVTRQFTHSSFEGPGRTMSRGQKTAGLLRSATAKIASEDAASRIWGGFSLLVLAQGTRGQVQA